MALQESVFANALQFGVDSVQTRAHDDERDEAQNDDAGLELEEGEIEDDDEEVVKETQGAAESSVSVAQNQRDKDKEGSTTNPGSQCATERSESHDCNTLERRRDRRPTIPVSSSSSLHHNGNNRGRKRTEDVSQGRDSHRKRRRTQEEDHEDMEEVDFEMMNARGHSPPNRPQRHVGGEELGSDEDMISSRRQQRGNADGRLRMGRTSPPMRRRSTRGNSRERGGGPDRRRPERGDRLERDRRMNKHSMSSSSLASSHAKSAKDESICAFYMEGKCSRGSDCPYSHAALPPRKMELCKFYLMDCCAKKDKCLYLHKDFPCKFFHTGKKCRFTAEDCKFSHDVLSDTMRAILVKHIETAPREILGDFPRLTREETIQAIEHNSPHPNEGREKRPHIPALFEPKGTSTVHTVASVASHDSGSYQPSNPDRGENTSTAFSHHAGFYQDVTTSAKPETDQNREERSPEENSRSIWFGKLRQETMSNQTGAADSRPEAASVVTSCRSSPPARKEENSPSQDYLSTLPARQRQLFRRIQQHQREPVAFQEGLSPTSERHPADNNWYSSDEDGDAESASDMLKSIRQKPELQRGDHTDAVVNPILPNLNLNSLENINVAEIAKALSSLQDNQPAAASLDDASDIARRDPRTRDPRMRSSHPSGADMGDVDLRIQSSQSRATPQQDVDLRLATRAATDIDLRVPVAKFENVGSSDIDLRRLAMPFIPSSTASLPPVCEIDASFDSHPPMEYRVWVVDFVPLDYSRIRVNVDWAHLDPRLQKSFSVGGATREFTSTDPPAIPLGPASPDPSPLSPSTTGRQLDMDASATYGSRRPGHVSDPRARDPRRSSAASNAFPAQQQSQPQGLEKRGLLGVAPPGMLPFLARSDVTGSHNPSDDSYGLAGSSIPNVDRPYSERELPARPAENRRDPRQRLRNVPASVDSPSRSYTPPRDRNFH